VRQRAALLQADEFGVRSRLKRPGAAENVVADGELGHGCSGRHDLAGELRAENPLLRPAESEEDADQPWLACPHAAVGPRDRSGADPHEHFVVLRDRLFDVLEPLNPGPYLSKTTLHSTHRV
jgi:hypothetical protein